MYIQLKASHIESCQGSSPVFATRVTRGVSLMKQERYSIWEHLTYISEIINFFKQYRHKMSQGILRKKLSKSDLQKNQKVSVLTHTLK